MNKIFRSLTLSAVLLASCFSVAQGFNRFKTPKVERLFSYTIGSQGVFFRVYSGGCTEKRSFRVQKLRSRVSRLLLYRIAGDECRAFFPEGVDVFFSFHELGLTRGELFQVINPLRKEQRLVRDF